MNFQTISTLLKLSRPRFWLYTAGPFLIGLSIINLNDLNNLNLSILFYGLFYFLIPANVFIYGVNDYFDRKIDLKNPKKYKQEKIMDEKEKKFYISICLISILLSIPLIFSNQIAAFFTILFLIFGFFYSSPPLRFKTKPFLDSISNFFYILPGIVSYSLITNSIPSLKIILAGCLWSVAMHLFSAIVDIKPDIKAEIKTTATLLGERNSLIVASFLWLISILLIINFSYFFLIGLIYPILPLLVIFNKTNVEKAYWIFPYINAFIGFILFWICVYVI